MGDRIGSATLGDLSSKRLVFCGGMLRFIVLRVVGILLGRWCLGRLRKKFELNPLKIKRTRKPRPPSADESKSNDFSACSNIAIASGTGSGLLRNVYRLIRVRRIQWTRSQPSCLQCVYDKLSYFRCSASTSNFLLFPGHTDHEQPADGKKSHF